MDELAASSALVKLLFGIRKALGRAFDWDRESAQIPDESFVHRLSAADRERSLIAPGTPEGSFRVLFASRSESISEIRNATAHAFTVFALVERPAGYRLYLGIYVLPVGRITRCYMRCVDPFRRNVIYPAILRHVRRAWERKFSQSDG